MPCIEVEEGVRIFVADLDPGMGRPVLFLHGWPVNHKMFEYQFDQLPKCGFRCIGMDLRGFGNSDKPWCGYGYDRLADDVRAVIDSLGLEDLTLVGHSMGGAISIRYMARHCGHKVAKLALLAAAAPRFTKNIDYPYGMTKDQVDAIIERTYADRPGMMADFGSMFFASNVSEAFRNWFNGLGLEASGHATAMCAISLRDEDLRNDLAGIQVPTAIFQGMLDRIVPYQSAMVTQEGIRGSELYLLEHSGHGVFYDELERFNRLFLQFLCR